MSYHTQHTVKPTFPPPSLIILIRVDSMQQTSDAPFSTMSLIPGEILSMILCHTMRSDIPVHFERFLERGRKFRRIGNSKAARKPKGGLSTYAERWLLNHLGLGQNEHFRDWLLINSTCRRFRAWGRKAFFSEKIFFSTALFWLVPWAKKLCAENAATARECLHHVIVEYRRARSMGSNVTIPENTLPFLRSMGLLVYCSKADILPKLNSAQLLRSPLPEEHSNLQQDLEVRVDRRQMDIIYGREFGDKLERVIGRDFSALRVLLRHHRKMKLAPPGFYERSKKVAPRNHRGMTTILYHECHYS